LYAKLGLKCGTKCKLTKSKSEFHCSITQLQYLRLSTRKPEKETHAATEALDIKQMKQRTEIHFSILRGGPLETIV
jgi:hypothetical protein